MKYLLVMLLTLPTAWSQDLSPEEQRQLLQEVKSLKERVNSLENKDDSASGFKSTDYESKTTEGTASPSQPAAPAMSDEQRREIMETVQKYKDAQVEQEKALKELEVEE